MPSSYVHNGRRLSYVTHPGYRQGTKPRNAGKKYPAETYTQDEMRRLLRAFGKGIAGGRDRALTVIQWRSGLRIAEAIALYPHDINLDAGTILVRHGKGDKRRLVGIDPEAGAVVERWLDRRARRGFTNRQPVFCVFSGSTRGKPVYASVYREALKAAGARAGIGGVGPDGERWGKRMHPHALRHTFASDAAREGIPVPLIQVSLGHSDLRTTSRYLGGLSHWEAIDAMRERSWGAAAPALLFGAAPVLTQQPNEVAQRARPLLPARR